MKRRWKRKLHKIRRAAAMAVCLLMTAGLTAPLLAICMPDSREGVAVHAEEPVAGGDLEIRVGYFGETGEYRTKAVLTREKLEELADAETYYFTNVTRVGTVMETVAWGPTILSVLRAADIKAESVETINLRTTDGKKVNNWFVSLNMDQWVNATRYYFPYLRSNYERIEDESGETIGDEGGMVKGAVMPGDRSLRGSKEVPSILAIESYATKDPNEQISPDQMNDEVSYRFCCGQVRMEDNMPCIDYSSMNSAQHIFGIDCTLSGSPGEATGIELDLGDSELVVGSKKKITAQILGDQFAPGIGFEDVTWSSSDPSIANIDQNGLLTVYKEGTVQITASAEGFSKTITIRAVAKKDNKKDEKKDQKKDNASPSNDNKSKSQSAASPQKKKSSTTTRKSNKASGTTLSRKSKKRQSEKKNETKKNSRAETVEPVKEVEVGMRELVLEEDMSEREEMSAEATPLDAKKSATPLAGVYAIAGVGTCAAAGGLTRFLWFLKEVH